MLKNDTRRVIQRLLRRVCAAEKRRARPVNNRPPPPIRLPQKYVDVARTLSEPDKMGTKAVRARMDKAHDYEAVHPDIIAFQRKMIAEMRRRGIPFYTFELWRSPERQAVLKKQGVTRAGPGSSPHQYGCAVDMVSATKYWDLTRKQWDVIGAIGKEIARRMNIKIVWGGDFKSIYDPAHWQLENWRDYKRAEQIARDNGTDINGPYRFAILNDIIRTQF